MYTYTYTYTHTLTHTYTYTPTHTLTGFHVSGPHHPIHQPFLMLIQLHEQEIVLHHLSDARGLVCAFLWNARTERFLRVVVTSCRWVDR